MSSSRWMFEFVLVTDACHDTIDQARSPRYLANSRQTRQPFPIHNPNFVENSVIDLPIDDQLRVLITT